MGVRLYELNFNESELRNNFPCLLPCLPRADAPLFLARFPFTDLHLASSEWPLGAMQDIRKTGL